MSKCTDVGHYMACKECVVLNSIKCTFLLFLHCLPHFAILSAFVLDTA